MQASNNDAVPMGKAVLFCGSSLIDDSSELASCGLDPGFPAHTARLKLELGVVANQFIVVCAKCGIEPKIVADAPGEMVACPSCGQRDDLREASRLAGEHFLEKAIPALQKGIGDAFKGPNTQFKPKPVRKRSFRWHAMPF